MKEQYWLMSRSVTHAQQMARILNRAGLHTAVRRADASLTGRGCGYSLTIETGKYDTAMQALRRAGVLPVKVFFLSGGLYREVSQ